MFTPRRLHQQSEQWAVVPGTAEVQLWLRPQRRAHVVCIWAASDIRQMSASTLPFSKQATRAAVACCWCHLSVQLFYECQPNNVFIHDTATSLLFVIDHPVSVRAPTLTYFEFARSS